MIPTRTISILVAGNIIDAAEQAECISGFSSFLQDIDKYLRIFNLLINSIIVGNTFGTHSEYKVP
jgi:hypothetical protein